MFGRLASVVLLAASLSACGGGDAPVTGSTPSAAGPGASSSAASSVPATTEPAPSVTAGSAAPATLQATVGTEANKEAFEIDLTRGGGTPVGELPAGEYTIEVQDYAKIHNFHLTGPGVDESTTVPFTGSKTWKVTLKPGTYTYVCDPHSGTMKGSFTVV